MSREYKLSHTAADINDKLEKAVEIKTMTSTEYDLLPETNINTLYILTDVDDNDVSTGDVYDVIASLQAEVDGKADAEHSHEEYLTSIPSEYVTETELNDKGYATISALETLQTEVNGKADSEHSHDNYATTSALETLRSEVDGKADAEHSHEEYLTSIPSEYVTETELNDKGYATTSALETLQTEVDGKADSEHSHDNYATTVTTTGSGNAITSISQSGNTITATKGSTFLTSVPSEYITETELNAKGYATTSALETLQTEVDGKASTTVVDDLADKVDTKADSGHTHDQYLTAIPSEYVTETELNAKGYATASALETLRTEVDGKQDALTFDTIPTSGSTNPVTSGGIHTALSEIQNGYEEYTDTAISNLINGAPTTLDTLGEIATAMEENSDVVEALNTAIGAKADASTLEALRTEVDGKQDTLTFDTAPTSGSTNPVTSGGIYTALGKKQDTLTFDTAPTSGSTKPVTSGGVYTALNTLQTEVDGKAVSGHSHSNYASTVTTTGSGNAITSITQSGNTITATKGTTFLTSVPSEYVTETELNAKGYATTSALETLQTEVDGKAASSHTHSSYVNQNAFSNVAVGSTTIAADSTTDTLTLVAGTNVTITPDATNDKITIAATDTVYSHPTTSGNKHIPSGGSSGQILRWSSDGTAAWGADNNTTYGVVSTTADGLAPKRDGSTAKFLRGDGTWAVPPDTNTTYSSATTSAAGLMSAADKTKLDGIATGANNYTYTLPAATSSVLGGVKIGSNITNSSGTISLTKANVTSALGYTPPTSDTNTTYSAGTGISLSGTTFSNSGVRSVTTGSTNGTISVNTNGTSAEVAVKGLGSAAYTASTAYAAASHGNHVPATETANNAKFLRNDNTWQTVTPANIGAAASSHTHSYAGSSSAGGAATSANKLNTNAGDANTPVYFSNGVPVACTSLDLNTSGSSASCTGNAATATELATARTIQTNLGSTSSASFNGTANVTPGVTGTLPIANGGTGATTAAGILTNLGITATAAELNYVDGVTSNIQTQLNDKQAKITGGISSALTTNFGASKAIVSNSSGKLASSTVTSTELGYLSGVTSNVQTQLDSKCNPNILDNWYFANPVNQKGVTTYTGTGYTIDRWMSGSNSATINIVDGGIQVSAGTAGYLTFRHFVENYAQYAGKQVTLSVLITDISTKNRVSIEVSSSSADRIVLEFSTAGLHSVTTTLPEALTRLYVSFAPLTNSTPFTIAAVKLELGDKQTLAHQDSDGNWVLNEIPNYADQLIKCQRYYQLFSSESARPTSLVDYRPNMRTTPNTGTVTINGTTCYYADANM